MLDADLLELGCIPNVTLFDTNVNFQQRRRPLTSQPTTAPTPVIAVDHIALHISLAGVQRLHSSVTCDTQHPPLVIPTHLTTPHHVAGNSIHDHLQCRRSDVVALDAEMMRC